MKTSLALFLFAATTAFAQTVTAPCAGAPGAIGTGVSNGVTAPCAAGGGGAFNVTVAGVSNTQAILTYTAPSGSYCTVEISESNTYLPLAHDVDPALFTNANRDSRPGGISSGTARVFVAGSRLPALALDATTVYSRALQAYTPHYARVTCDGSVATATFTTSNVPVGSTFAEPYAADPSTPGGWLLPTLTDVRTQTINEPQTGFQLSPVSLPVDAPNTPGHAIYTGAQVRPANPVLHTDGSGNQGYILNLDSQNGNSSAYFLIPATGEVRHLGYNALQPGAFLSDDLTVTTGDTAQPTPSASSLTIHTGTVVFGTGDSSPLSAGLRASACKDDGTGNQRQDTTKCMVGTIDSYICSAGCAITMTVTSTVGSGTYDSWILLGVDNIFKYTYTGAFNSVASYVPLPVSAPVVFTGVSGATLMHTFDSTFDLNVYTNKMCSLPYAVAGQTTIILCSRGQDGYGWIGGLYGGDGRSPIPSSCDPMDTECPRVVVAWNTLTDQRTKCCGIHATLPVSGSPLFSVNWHGMDTNNPPGTSTQPGLAAWTATIAADAAAGTNTITLTSDLASNAVDPITPLPTLAAGDRILVNGYSNGVKTVQSRSGLTLTLTSNLGANVTAGQKIQMYCNAQTSTEDGGWAIAYFDPTDRTGNTLVYDLPFAGGGHFDIGTLSMVAEAGSGFDIRNRGSGSFLSTLNTPVTVISTSPAFNGVAPPGFGILSAKYPTYHQTTTAPWFFARLGTSGGDASCTSPSGGGYVSACPGVDAPTGQRYKYHIDSAYPLKRKLIPTNAFVGTYPLRDVSGPGCSIGTGSGDSYTYGVVRVAGECVSGSVPGEIYANAPNVRALHICSGGSGGDINPTDYDICINNFGGYTNGMMQMYLGTDSGDAQSKSRSLGQGIAGAKGQFSYTLLKSTALGEYGLFTKGYNVSGNPDGNNKINVWKVKMTPLPAPDAVDRTKYISTPVAISSPPATTDNVIVRFWYTENNGYCGSRAEDCYAVANTIPGGDDPYMYPSDGSAGTLATLTGLSCAVSCSVAVPATTGHVLYYQIVYRTAANAILSTSAVKVAVIP